MLTTFEQVREWISENGFKRWVLYKDFGKTEKIIDSSAFTVSDLADKLAMTEKYLRLSGGHAYAAGGTSGGASDLNTIMEIRLADEQPQQQQPTSGIDAQALGALQKQWEAAMDAKWEKKLWERDKEAFEKEKKQFESDRNGVLGAIVGVLAPYLPVLNGAAKNMRLVAGVDTQEPVHAAPIVPTTREQADDQPEEQQQSPFTDEEEEKIYDLMVRFAKVEPDYMQLLESVVKMAESGDGIYTTAKGFLVK